MLISDDQTQRRQLERDLKASKFVYFLRAFESHDRLADSVRHHIGQTGDKSPTVLVIDFKFAGNDTEDLLKIARALSRRHAIECVVTAPPHDASRRHKFMALGARLFDGEWEQASLEATLH
ncbi:MAG: hypothetical protein JSR81_02920 [Proteobacteria bacterium]|nr:hypothetical protein [Pseudomonadota bacterium]